MPPPPTDRLRVVRYAPGWGFAASEWARALEQIPWSRAHADGGPQRLKIRGKGTPSEDVPVWQATLKLGGAEREVVLKVERMRTLRRRLQAAMRLTKHFRQWRGAERVEAAGFHACRPHAVLRARTPMGETADVLVLEALPGRSVLELLAWEATSGRPDEALGVRERHALASSVGLWTGDLLRAGVFNRDHKPSNIIALPDGGFALVDTVGVWDARRRREPGDRTEDLVLSADDRDTSGFDARDPGLPAAMLASLWLEPAGIGRPVSRATAMRAVIGLARGSRPFARAVWRAAEQFIRDHGDPTPADDPLARG